MNEDKKLLDLEGLQRYDTKVKEYIGTKVEEAKVTPITDDEIGNLFEQGLLETKYVSQDNIQEAINSEY